MQKVKLQIKGMHCQSCVSLIEKKLKELDGVIEAKANFDSQKAVVIYDENKIKEKEIKKTVEDGGEYRIVEEDHKTNNIEKKESKQESALKKDLFIPVSIIIAGLIVAGAIIISGRNSQSNQGDIAGKQAAQILPDANSQPLPTPSNQEEKIVQFEITKNDHVRGDFNAPITLVEFSDFECPFCKRHYPTLNKILKDYKGKARLVYKHLPLGVHPNAQKAAEASECASEQEKFWEYHDKLFDNFDLGYSTENFKKWAKDLSLNTDKFNECLDSGKFAQKVQADYQEGSQKGVNGTPATFVNGQLVSGAVPYESFKQIIDSLF